jgi:prepilin-type processing-associated H-X9-DG protein
MGGLDPRRGIAENYRVFGREARGRSAVYESLAAAVAADGLVLGFLATLPPPKRQPNLLFAAARYLLGVPPDIAALRTLVRRNGADLLTDLPALAAQAPADATLVIFHSAVLAYVAPRDRDRFARTVRGLAAVWLSNEAPGVVPGLPHAEFREGTFVLGHGGRTPLAFADGHGTWLHWLDGAGG